MDSIDAVLEAVISVNELPEVQQIATSASPQVEEQEDRLRPVLEQIKATNGLDEDQARTIVYYSIATRAVDRLNKFPILVLYGTAGTGKTTLLEVLQELTVGSPDQLSSGDMTYAVLRDTLANRTTVLIDEADDVHEKLLTKRYSKKSGNLVVNKAGISGGWSKVQGNVYGATVLHRRKQFKDEAVQSRSIVVRTKKAKVLPYTGEEFTKFVPILDEIAEEIDWEEVSKKGSDRIADTWAALLAIDDAMGGKWRFYAEGQMEAARKNLDYGQEVEPDKAVYLAFLANALDDMEVKERVLIGDIVKETPADLDLNAWQVGLTLRYLGFETKTKGGKQYAFTGGQQNLIAIGRGLDVEDGWFDEVEMTEA